MTLSGSKTKTGSKYKNRWQPFANKNRSADILNKQSRQEDYTKMTTQTLAINWWSLFWEQPPVQSPCPRFCLPMVLLSTLFVYSADIQQTSPTYNSCTIKAKPCVAVCCILFSHNYFSTKLEGSVCMCFFLTVSCGFIAHSQFKKNRQAGSFLYAANHKVYKEMTPYCRAVQALWH